MSHFLASFNQDALDEDRSYPASVSAEDKSWLNAAEVLAADITKYSSLQTYLTIRYLVDDQLVDDAYRAYAYFRWVDDTLDDGQMPPEERLAFLARQRDIITRCYRGERPAVLCLEEYMVVDLIHNGQLRCEQEEHCGLRKYIDNMMVVMSFDAGRKGKLVTQIQLEQYTHSLAVAVTEAMHYFIGFDDYSPQDETRYTAVTGAHITHILRDAVEDAQMGYYNIPREYLDKHNIAPTDFDHKAFQDWVCDQVRLARRCFGAGKIYMARVENLRCRLAGYAYIKRFEIVLDAIENEKYVLRAAYPERKTAKARIKMALSAIGQTIGSSLRARPSKAPALVPLAEV